MRAEDILPDHQNQGEFGGLTIRKGTVAAFLANARTWTGAGAGTPARAQAAREIERDLPALRALGLLEVMEIRDEALRAFVAGA